MLQLNKICKEVGVVSAYIRNSIPEKLTNESDIRDYLHLMKEDSIEWNAMKLVVLGHGRIGKTTLIQTLKHILHSPILSQFGIRNSKVSNLLK